MKREAVDYRFPQADDKVCHQLGRVLRKSAHTTPLLTSFATGTPRDEPRRELYVTPLLTSFVTGTPNGTVSRGSF